MSNKQNDSYWEEVREQLIMAIKEGNKEQERALREELSDNHFMNAIDD